MRIDNECRIKKHTEKIRRQPAYGGACRLSGFGPGHRLSGVHKAFGGQRLNKKRGQDMGHICGVCRQPADISGAGLRSERQGSDNQAEADRITGAESHRHLAGLKL